MSAALDRDLQQRVECFLRQKNVLRRDNVQIDVDSGVVTLEGRVYSYYEKQRFLSACQHVAGVVSIVDNINVRASATSREAHLIGSGAVHTASAVLEC